MAGGNIIYEHMKDCERLTQSGAWHSAAVRVSAILQSGIATEMGDKLHAITQELKKKHASIENGLKLDLAKISKLIQHGSSLEYEEMLWLMTLIAQVELVYQLLSKWGLHIAEIESLAGMADDIARFKDTVPDRASWDSCRTLVETRWHSGIPFALLR